MVLIFNSGSRLCRLRQPKKKHDTNPVALLMVSNSICPLCSAARDDALSQGGKCGAGAEQKWFALRELHAKDAQGLSLDARKLWQVSNYHIFNFLYSRRLKAAPSWAMLLHTRRRRWTKANIVVWSGAVLAVALSRPYPVQKYSSVVIRSIRSRAWHIPGEIWHVFYTRF